MGNTQSEKHARWIDVTSELWSRLVFKKYQCSACGFETGIRTDKCFDCGAEMEIEELSCSEIPSS